MTYLITGSTGNIGSLVAESLIAAGERPRAFVRDAEKARARFGKKVEIRTGDLADAASLRAALVGVDVLFLLNSGHTLAELDALAAEAAKRAGVKRIVKLSSLDARQGVGTGVWHAAGEAAIRESGIAFTFVQPTGFMSNALYWARTIREKGVVESATGHGKIPFVHPRDIADVVVAAMRREELVGRSLGLTGPEALSYEQMGAMIGAAIGREIRFVEISEEEARAQQVAWNSPEPMLEARLSIFRAIHEGRMAEVTDTVENVLGRQPVSFGEWVKENAAAFRG